MAWDTCSVCTVNCREEALGNHCAVQPLSEWPAMAGFMAIDSEMQHGRRSMLACHRTQSPKPTHNSVTAAATVEKTSAQLARHCYIARRLERYCCRQSTTSRRSTYLRSALHSGESHELSCFSSVGWAFHIAWAGQICCLCVWMCECRSGC